MIALTLHLDGDGCWPDLKPGGFKEADRVDVAALAEGMASGSPSVCIRLDCEDGTVVLGQTSLALFLTASDALRTRYGDPRS